MEFHQTSIKVFVTADGVVHLRELRSAVGHILHGEDGGAAALSDAQDAQLSTLVSQPLPSVSVPIKSINYCVERYIPFPPIIITHSALTAWSNVIKTSLNCRSNVVETSLKCRCSMSWHRAHAVPSKGVRTVTAPSLHHHCTITAPSLHHHRTSITAPSRFPKCLQSVTHQASTR